MSKQCLISIFQMLKKKELKGELTQEELPVIWFVLECCRIKCYLFLYLTNLPQTVLNMNMMMNVKMLTWWCCSSEPHRNCGLSQGLHQGQVHDCAGLWSTKADCLLSYQSARTNLLCFDRYQFSMCPHVKYVYKCVHTVKPHPSQPPALQPPPLHCPPPASQPAYWQLQHWSGQIFKVWQLWGWLQGRGRRVYYAPSICCLEHLQAGRYMDHRPSGIVGQMDWAGKAVCNSQEVYGSWGHSSSASMPGCCKRLLPCILYGDHQWNRYYTNTALTNAEITVLTGNEIQRTSNL